MANPPGAPLTLTEERSAQIVAAVKKVLVKRHVAGMCKISHTTINKWINQGDDDITGGLHDTLFAQFSTAYKFAQAEKVAEYIAKIEDRQPGWQAIAWLLERCFREDFGADAGIIQELAEKQNKLEIMLTNKLEGTQNDAAT